MPVLIGLIDVENFFLKIEAMLNFLILYPICSTICAIVQKKALDLFLADRRVYVLAFAR